MSIRLFRKCYEKEAQPLNNKGFSLIEVLVALVILAIGLLAIANLQIASTRGNFFSNNLMQATYIAQDRLEFIKNFPSTSPQLNAGNYNDGTSTISGIVYNRRYSVTANGDLRTINYIVTWNDGTGHTISFSTIRTL